MLRTEHFDIYFYASEREATLQAARMAERWYARLARIFNHQIISRQPLILYASHPDFEQTNVIEGVLGEGTGGVTEALKRRIVLPLGGPLAESDHVIGHELVHAFQFDITAEMGMGGNGTGSGVPAAERLPLWFIEGMAEYLSLGPVDPNTTMWMRDAASQERMPTIHELTNQQYFPYRWGQALWAYIAGRWGDSVIGPLLSNAAAGASAEAALGVVLHVSADQLSAEWQAALRADASVVRQQTRPLSAFATPLETDAGAFPGLSVSPAISPDGRRFMFLSERSLIAVDLFLADASTGRVTRRVTNTAVDPHFSSLEFINSAGAWSPDSRHFVVPAVHGGAAALAIYSGDGGALEREIDFADLGEVFNPAWSPDGRFLAFAGLEGGLTDLFLVDLETGSTRRLTHDAFADLQPAWSPDGRTLAFVTDRYSTHLEDLAFGNYQIALLDVTTGGVRPLAGADFGKNINPLWASDSEILFVSDRTGISNIYRVGIANGRAVPVTNVATGVSGITALSPAISLARERRRLIFSVYEHNGYRIYGTTLQGWSQGEGTAQITGLDPGRLPPSHRSDDDLLATLRADVTLGQAAARDPKVAPYAARLALDLVGQPRVTAGVGSYGTFVGGGLSLFWSDLLGDYNLGTALQVNSGFGGLSDTLRNTGVQVAFSSRKHRWNYGFAAGQTPYLAGGISESTTSVNGTAAGQEQLVIYRQVERSAMAVAAYPINEALRLEFAGGYSHVSFDQQVETLTFDPTTLNVLSDQTSDTPTSGPLSLGEFSAAVVYDTSIVGPTSPITGQSARVQLSPTIGNLRFDTVLADYRRYVMPAPFYTLAVRLLHFGRYGPDAEDPRLVPLYLGYPGLVRGYTFDSFGAGECTPAPNGLCEELDRLVGSRVLVGNLEFRFPLLRPLGVKPKMYGPVPIELGVFADAGVAWSRGQTPRLFGGDRRGVSSTGLVARVRLFGLIPAEFDVAKPLQRTSHGWVFQFSIQPGW